MNFLSKLLECCLAILFCLNSTDNILKVQMKFFLFPKFERAADIRKIAVYRFLISLLSHQTCPTHDVTNFIDFD